MHPFPSPKNSITLTFTHDLSNYAADDAYTTARVNQIKQQISFDTTTNQLRKEVRSAITTLLNAYKSFESVVKAKALSIQKLQGEFDRYRLGESSIKNVIDFQKEEISQEKAELDARIALLQAHSQLRKVQGLAPEHIDLTIFE
jgi:outer membrane protein TolC